MSRQSEARRKKEYRLLALLKPIIDDFDMAVCIGLDSRERGITDDLIAFLEKHPDAKEYDVQKWLWPEEFEEDKEETEQ